MDLVSKYKSSFGNKSFVFSFIASLLFLAVGIVVTYFAIVYATDRASNSVTDVILSNTRVFDVDGIFIWGPVIFWAIIGFYLISKPNKFPFTLKSIALFTIIRAAFISMTHIGPFPTTAVQVNLNSVIGVFTSGSDLFFSSHTGLPFLMAMVFWNDKFLRYFSLIASLLFGTIVLLGHLHYSIDVFSAFFITYAIFAMAENLFKKDRRFFLGFKD